MTPQKTTIDWLRFRAQAEPRDILETMRPMFGEKSDMLHFRHLDRGILGFQRGANLMLADMNIGRMDWGGESQRGWVRTDIPGKGCEWVKDWDAADAVQDLPSAELTRGDVALTTWDGEVTHERVVQAHQEGRFITRGRPPALKQILSSDERAGRTCYIGTREKSDKFLRCYEKGYELAGILGARYGLRVNEIDGKPVEDIYRVECEFKAASAPLPWDLLRRPDQFFVGAYPFCADVLPGVEPDVLMRRPERAPQLDLAAALENCRRQFGPTLFTALAAYQGDIGAVWDRVVGRDHNKALVEAGVLMVDHD